MLNFHLDRQLDTVLWISPIRLTAKISCFLVLDQNGFETVELIPFYFPLHHCVNCAFCSLWSNDFATFEQSVAFFLPATICGDVFCGSVADFQPKTAAAVCIVFVVFSGPLENVWNACWMIWLSFFQHYVGRGENFLTVYFENYWSFGVMKRVPFPKFLSEENRIHLEYFHESFSVRPTNRNLSSAMKSFLFDWRCSKQGSSNKLCGTPRQHQRETAWSYFLLWCLQATHWKRCCKYPRQAVIVIDRFEMPNCRSVAVKHHKLKKKFLN